MLAERLVVAEVVVLLDQAVEQPLLTAPPHLPKLQRAKLCELTTHRSRAHGHRRRRPTLDQRVAGPPTHRRQLDVTGPVKRQHQATADHVAQGAVGLTPVPGLTQPLRQRPMTGLRVASDQPSDEDDVRGTDLPTSVAQHGLHRRRRYSKRRWTQGPAGAPMCGRGALQT